MDKVRWKEDLSGYEKLSADEILKRICSFRSIENIEEFISPPHPCDYSLDTFSYSPQARRAIEILEKAKKEDKVVVVYMDYDADGITGGAIMWETLHVLGFKTMPYVPHRVTEGYGFSLAGIDKVKNELKADVIISVDHGIAAVEQVAYAKSLGLDIIVTDHHLKQERIPDEADVIIHIPKLSGSGVSYYTAKEIYMYFSRNDTSISPTKIKNLEHNFLHDYVMLAAIGTIADLVPLTGVSRSIAFHGLKSCRHTTKVGIKHILKEAKIEGRDITPFEVGFIIAPRINAVGRLEHALDALRLICTTNDDRAYTLANKVGDQNTERKEMVAEAVTEARKMVDQLRVDGELPHIIAIKSDWHEGIIGLVASRLLEEHYRPVIVMTQHDGMIKASARSIPSFHITDFLTSLKRYLVSFGGHAAAAGFSMKEEGYKQFIRDVYLKAQELISPEDLIRIYEADIKMPLSLVTSTLVKKIDALQPFGVGNPQPLFVSDVEVVKASCFGKKGEHLKILGKIPEIRSYPLEFILFGGSSLITSLSRGGVYPIVYKVTINTWNGRETLRGMITYIDIK